jgi:hypothetical protein
MELEKKLSERMGRAYAHMWFTGHGCITIDESDALDIVTQLLQWLTDLHEQRELNDSSRH